MRQLSLRHVCERVTNLRRHIAKISECVDWLRIDLLLRWLVLVLRVWICLTSRSDRITLWLLRLVTSRARWRQERIHYLTHVEDSWLESISPLSLLSLHQHAGDIQTPHQIIVIRRHSHQVLSFIRWLAHESNCLLSPVHLPHERTWILRRRLEEESRRHLHRELIHEGVGML